ncbi:portal protein [Inquilinus limosus]|uniref:Phage portal protein n=1 Tax=Inquilinus limosus TaxID=171674 RepID=A0A211ZQB9_9PROT|nr:hypothetical protein [Inquilinus limosus]OWJ67439.1 hypothetical protein BWR60_09545 [Inquilinus limosus]
MADYADDAPETTAGEGEAMSDSELAALIDQYVADSGGIWDQPLDAYRERALRYYRGDPRGDEVDGRSQVVSRDVAEAVDGMLPDLLEIFVSGDQLVRFDPMGPEDEEGAEQATDYVNWIFSQDNPGFEILYTWFKDALLNKNGVVKVWWRDEKHTKDERYCGLTDDELALLETDPATEIVEKKPSQMSEAASAEMQAPLYDVQTRVTVPGGKICIECVPPEEFLIWSRSKGFADTPFIGQRLQKRKSDLIEEGFDREIVEGLPSDDQGDDLHGEKLERFKDLTQIPMNSPTLDESMRMVWAEEVFIRVDRDGDGIAELRKITKVNDTILDDTKVDDHWFAGLSPNPMPHTWEGRSIADETMDIQDIKTAVTRGSLDSLYLSNNPRQLVRNGKVNLDDVLNSRPGGVIRVADNAGPLADAYQAQVTPFVGQSSFPMIEYLDQVIERRTGLIRQAQGMDPDVINKTATAARIMNSAGQRRLKMIARIFAETGVKRAFELIYAAVKKYQQRPKVIRLRNKWVPMDPRGWADKMDLKVSVGLGTGDRQEQLAAILQSVVPAQQATVQLQGGVQGPMVKMDHLYNTARKLVEFGGLKSPELYFGDPSDPANQPPPSPPPPDPKMLEAQGKLQLEQQKAQTQIQLQMQQGAAEIEMRRQLAEQELALKREELAARRQMEREKAAQDYELRRMEMDAEIALKRYQIEKQAETAQATNVPKPE